MPRDILRLDQALGLMGKKVQRDRDLPLRVRLFKGLRYGASLITAPLYLRSVELRGSQVRTIGKPRIENWGTMQLGSHVVLRSLMVPVELATGPGALLRIGNQCSLNYGVSIGALQRVELDDRVRVGPYVMIIDSEFHDAYQRNRRPTPRPVHIHSDVWIGAKAAILPGVTIGRGSIVATGAVVTRDVPPFSVVAGVPATVVKSLDPNRFKPEDHSQEVV